MNSKKYFLIIILTINFSCNMSQKNNNDTIFASIETNKGVIKTQLFFKQTPITVANFISLAEGDNKEVSSEYKGKKYYNGITFHRVIPDFMAQGGDPLGNGTGGSGQNIDAEFSSEKHIRGTVSMARAQDPNSADSQFFICFTDASWLDGQYTIWGQVIEGMEHVDKIKKGDGSNGEVSNPDKIISIKLVSIKPKKTKK